MTIDAVYLVDVVQDVEGSRYRFRQSPVSPWAAPASDDGFCGQRSVAMGGTASRGEYLSWVSEAPVAQALNALR
jgi:hypothetical protein